MSYRVISIYNHNTVLAEDKNNKKVLVLNKGIGFGKKSGDIITNIPEDKKMYYILQDSASDEKLRKLSNELEALPEIVSYIVKCAYDELNIDNDKLYDALIDHISFAIQRLNLDLPIENPFITEISVLYPNEYKLAKKMSKIINERLNISIGKSEEGFIALHIYSAREQKSINKTIKKTRIYNKIFNTVNNDINIGSDVLATKNFIYTLDKILSNPQKDIGLSKIFKERIKSEFPQIYNLVLKISEISNEELGLGLSDDMLATLSIELIKTKILSI